MSEVKMKMMDGNEAAASVAHRMNEVCVIYPITPSSPMGEWADAWSAAKQKNLWGVVPEVQEMQSEAGAAGACHGSVQAGALTTTFTASQGLLLMIPNMYKIAGELSPFVMHVAARSLAYHALSIFGDHTDVMSCRQTGFAMLASNSVQEAHDMAAIAQTSTLRSRVPFMHFFDGFRTSHEIKKIKVLSDDDLRAMLEGVDYTFNAKHALRPEAPVIRGTAQNPDVFFQGREACNPYYDKVEGIVQEEMDKFAKISGRQYHVVDYVGAADAEQVIVIMGSGAETVEETINYLNAEGAKLGVLKIHLYRPFPEKSFLKALPKSVKVVSVLDRTKESGSIGEPLYLDVVATLTQAFANGEIANMPKVVGGRYGLSSKEFTPGMVKAVFDNGFAAKSINGFSVGITDDVTHKSLAFDDSIDTEPKDVVRAVFYGLGADGTVGANKNSIKIIAEDAGKYGQGYFVYDSRKSGSMTTSHLRFSDNPIKSAYLINKADFVACHQFPFMNKVDILKIAKPGATFLLNAPYAAEEVWNHLPIEVQEEIIAKKLNFYSINAVEVARETGMGQRINTVMQTCFFAISNILPKDEAIAQIKNAIKKTYSKKGDAVVQMNWKAIDAGLDAVHKVEVPASWSNPAADPAPKALKGPDALVKQIRDVMEPISRMDGDSLPVSAFEGNVNGEWEQGASAYEKRGTAVMVPEWDAEKCIQCNQCAFVCSHATIRPFCLTADEAANAPESTKLADTKPKASEYKFTMAVSPLDCMGCGECVTVCPTAAIEMKPQESQSEQQAAFDYCVENIRKKDNIPGVVSDISVKGSQFNQPLLEFSGSCAGCAETSYARLITQLFGEKMFISNATGCSSIWGGTASISPYTTNKESGHGPAWINSLFEDNAEHGLGMQIGYETVRANLITKVEALKGKNAELDAVIDKFLETKNNTKANDEPAKALIAALEACGCDESKEILKDKQYLAKKSFWIFGGDGWAYDIGYGGLDHVLASGEDVNVMVFDTEMYSNTGGQASKASNIGEVCQFAAAGKEISKKSLSEIAMTYGYIYVAQIALGANMNQAVKAIAEAEAYPGPSLIIGYAPCELHGVKGGMTNCQNEMKKAVEAGYWNLFTFNPANKAQGKNPFTLTSKAVDAEKYQALLANETRYSRLTRAFPERAKELFARNQEVANDRYEHLTRLVELYK